MPEAAALPHLNATLNAISAFLLAAGFLAIRRSRQSLHRNCMLGAFTASILFLVSYPIYHFQVGSVRFTGTGALRGIYLSILFTHSLLAAAVPVLAIITLRRALQGRFSRHASLARWTLPIWFYVSVTGIVVYWMLYHLQT